MSNFQCRRCGAVLVDSPAGYVTGCEHYPIEKPKSQSGIDRMVEQLQERRKEIAKRKAFAVEYRDEARIDLQLRENRSALDMALLCQSFERENAAPNP